MSMVSLPRTLPSAPATTTRPPSQRHRTLQRLGRMHTAMAGLAVLLLVVLVAVGAPLLAPEGYDAQNFRNRTAPPVWVAGGSLAHPLGTDPLGRGVLARMMYAAQISLAVAGLSVVVAGTVGVLVGLVAGYRGAWFDAILMRLADIQLSFPYLLLAIAVMALLQPSLTNLILVLALRSWVVYARTVRGSVLAVKKREFIEAALMVGASGRRVMFRHLAPNVVAPVIVISSFQFAELIIAEASLSFLGLGVQPPTPSWGGMLSQGREYLSTAWWLAVFPGLAIIVTVLGINLLGDGLRDALDPRLK